MLEDEELFAEVWNNAEAFQDVCRHFETTQSKVSCRASYLRSKGVFLKRFPSNSLTENYKPENTPKPTKALPGTNEKIEVLSRRVENNEKLFHDSDKTFDGCIGADVRLASKTGRQDRVAAIHTKTSLSGFDLPAVPDSDPYGDING